jgi:hypothetical protein
MKFQTLLLTNAEVAFELLAENAGCYGDNGGDPDGNAWLPSEPLDLTDDGVADVINAGYGVLVSALYTDLSDILNDVPAEVATDIRLAAEQSGHDPTAPEYDDVRDALAWSWRDARGDEHEAPRWAGYSNFDFIIVF